MDGRLTGKTAWISGASSGIGAATARLFVEEGANVARVDIRADRGEMTAEHGGASLVIHADVSVEAQVRDSLATTVDAFGGLNIIVNCAGVVHVKLLHEYDEADWDRLMGVNLKGIFFSVKHGVQYLRRTPPSYVVNIGSISSFVGQAATPAYTASKSAVLGLSRSIALDYAAIGLRCNCVCPGITDTPMLREHLDRTPDPEATLAERLRRVPLRLPLSPRDIAKAVLYLSCEDSVGVTGTSLVVDGGYLAAAEWDAR
ncbi:MAG TPA: SDR family NAD(P)-dependent oxidoreductase [Isosphaeraceae bacterium]|nr:SDR family NAD(P)-dependent oxidoreductase [Isosphaeraceae bacterium]